MVKLCYSSWLDDFASQSGRFRWFQLSKLLKDDIAERHVEERRDIWTFEMFKNTQSSFQVRSQRILILCIPSIKRENVWRLLPDVRSSTQPNMSKEAL
jgi:transposase